jgi:hypothetical protein
MDSQIEAPYADLLVAPADNKSLHSSPVRVIE